MRSKLFIIVFYSSYCYYYCYISTFYSTSSLKSFIKFYVSSYIFYYNINYFLVYTVFHKLARDLYLIRGIGANDLTPLKDNNSIYSLNFNNLSYSSTYFYFYFNFSCLVVSIYEFLSLYVLIYIL